MPVIESPGHNPIPSPCVKVCTLDARAGLCLGCGRTLDEIERWMRMGAEERRRVMAELPSRLARRSAVTLAAE
jgi:uncharacterized protein